MNSEAAMTQDNVSEELVQAARSAVEDGGGWFISSDDMRLALNAIAPRLRAEGLREAAGIADEEEEFVKYDDGNADASCHEIARECRARADALDPPPQQEDVAP